MNKPVAIILLVVLAVILVLLLRILIPVLSNYFKNLPKGIFILLFLLIIVAMVYLIYFIASSEPSGGEFGKDSDKPVAEQKDNQNDVILEIVENCIILRDDEIWINNMQVDMAYAEKYIDEHVESNTPIVIVDDYSLASLHHKITDLCDKKGVKYSTEDEKGNKS